MSVDRLAKQNPAEYVRLVSELAADPGGFVEDFARQVLFYAKPT